MFRLRTSCVLKQAVRNPFHLLFWLYSLSLKNQKSVFPGRSLQYIAGFFFFFVNDWAVLACRSGDRKCGTSVDDLCVVAEISCKCGRYRSTYRTRRMGLNQMRDRLSAQLPFPESPTCGSILPVLAWILQVGGGH